MSLVYSVAFQYYSIGFQVTNQNLEPFTTNCTVLGTLEKTASRMRQWLPSFNYVCTFLGDGASCHSFNYLR